MICTAVDGVAHSTVRPLSSNIARTFAQAVPDTKMLPLRRVPRFTMAVESFLETIHSASKNMKKKKTLPSTRVGKRFHNHTLD